MALGTCADYLIPALPPEVLEYSPVHNLHTTCIPPFKPLNTPCQTTSSSWFTIVVHTYTVHSVVAAALDSSAACSVTTGSYGARVRWGLPSTVGCRLR
jgi:hypothetical protein